MIGLNTRMEQDLVQKHNAKVSKEINLNEKNLKISNSSRTLLPFPSKEFGSENYIII